MKLCLYAISWMIGAVFIFGGFYALLFFVPAEWGHVNEDGFFMSVRAGLALTTTIGAFALWVFVREYGGAAKRRMR